MADYYNEEIKQKYIDTVIEDNKEKPNSNKLKSVIGIMKRVAPYEESLGKDVFQMKTDEIVDMILSFKLSSGTAINYRTNLHKYIDWCKNHGYCTVNYLDKDFLSLSKFKDYLNAENNKANYITPEMYEECIKLLKERLNSDIDLSIFCGVYEGLTLEELSALRKSDINYEESYIAVPRGNIKVSKDLILKLYHTFNTNTLETKNGKIRKLPYRRHYDSIFCYQREDVPKYEEDSLRRRANSIRIYLSENLGFNDRLLSVTDWYNSGLLNYMIQRTSEYGVDFVNDLRIGRTYRFKYDVAESNYYYNLVQKEKCIQYDIGNLRVRMQFLLENLD